MLPFRVKVTTKILLHFVSGRGSQINLDLTVLLEENTSSHPQVFVVSMTFFY